MIFFLKYPLNFTQYGELTTLFIKLNTLSTMVATYSTNKLDRLTCIIVYLIKLTLIYPLNQKQFTKKKTCIILINVPINNQQ